MSRESGHSIDGFKGAVKVLASRVLIWRLARGRNHLRAHSHGGQNSFLVVVGPRALGSYWLIAGGQPHLLAALLPSCHVAPPRGRSQPGTLLFL